jgi:hypothetical protein
MIGERIKITTERKIKMRVIEGRIKTSEIKMRVIERKIVIKECAAIKIIIKI